MQLKVSPVSPEQVLRRSFGEVKIDETLNFKNGLPVEGGLICQKIFGPVKDYVCACEKYSGQNYAGITCEKCGVTVLHSRSRSERMGHIDLQVPIINPLTIRGVMSIIDVTKHVMLNYLQTKAICAFVEGDDGNLILKDGRRGRIKIILNGTEDGREDPDREHAAKDAPHINSVGLYHLIEQIDVAASVTVNESPVLRLYHKEGFDPCHLFLRYLPVLPATYRPVVKHDNYYSTDPKNDLYAKITRRAIRLRTLMDYNAPHDMIGLENGLVYKAVAQLFMGGATDGKGNELKGIIDHLTKKSGLVRNNLLGKRVDYSGRSVITSSGDTQEMGVLGLPRKMAYILFKPFIINYILENYVDKVTEALDLYERKTPAAKKALEMVVKGRRVMMNRQPTLHRYGVMSFRIRLINGNAILLHPMICAPFNADFDGDTVAIHVPLSPDALEECDAYMSPEANLLSSLDGHPMINASHEMVIGLAMMTRAKDEGRKFDTFKRMQDMEYLHELIDPNTGHACLRIYDKIRFQRANGERVETCYGRLLLEEVLETTDLPSDFNKKTIRHLTSRCYDFLGPEKTVKALDQMMKLSLKYVTEAGFSVGIRDCVIPSTKAAKVAKAREEEKINNQGFKDGLITENARFENNVRMWDGLQKELHKDWENEAGADNSIVMMLTTGARVGASQVDQLNVMKGLVSDSGNNIIEHPVINSLKEGLDTLEYTQTCRGARKSMSDKKNLTPDSGYLTRRMVTAARDLFITENKCNTRKGIVRPRYGAIGRYTIDGQKIEKSLSRDLVEVRSPIYCTADRGICQHCFGTDPATRRLVRIGSNVGTVAAHSLTESTTQMTMRTFHFSGAAVIQDSPMVIRTDRKGKFTVHSNAQSVWSELRVCTDPEQWDGEMTSYVKYYIDTTYAKLLARDGDVIEENTPIAVYEFKGLQNDDISGSLPMIDNLFEARVTKNPKAVVALKDGTVSLRTADNSVLIYIDDELQGEVSKLPVFVADGQKVNAGMLMSYGAPDFAEVYKKTENLDLTYGIFEKAALNIYIRESLVANVVHLEMIFRAMSNIVELDSGLFGLRSHGDVGKTLVLGITDVGQYFPSWLKSIGFGWLGRTLASSAVFLRETYDVSSERLMSGELIFDKELYD